MAPVVSDTVALNQVMMYCTGGIRCERASALLDQMERSSHDVATQGIYMVRGGIERYLKTFPQGGFWKGYNYLFDRRFEQRPAVCRRHLPVLPLSDGVLLALPSFAGHP